jgi:hypothetical protein
MEVEDADEANVGRDAHLHPIALALGLLKVMTSPPISLTRSAPPTSTMVLELTKAIKSLGKENIKYSTLSADNRLPFKLYSRLELSVNTALCNP